MLPIRILIVTDVPLSAELGAGQMTLNLAEALRSLGHDVTLWSPHPVPPKIKRHRQWARSKLDAFIEKKSFDLIDCPAILITHLVSKSAIVVSRSVQPEISYLLHGLKQSRGKGIKGIIRTLLYYLDLFFLLVLIVPGWSRATYILCLGSLEFHWMRKWLPWWQSKIIYYFNALSGKEQVALTEVRLNRQQRSQDSFRFLWIGRWVTHKGTDILLKFIIEWNDLRPQDTFTIAGCGTAAEKDCPPDLLQSGRVKILPSFDRSQLYSLLDSHDIGLFTSKVEGWGLVLNEMLESGMPVFASPSGGVPDLQPFFKETLKPFPPPLDLTLNIINKVGFPEEYYQEFTWIKTAHIYESLGSLNNDA